MLRWHEQLRRPSSFLHYNLSPNLLDFFLKQKFHNSCRTRSLNTSLHWQRKAVSQWVLRALIRPRMRETWTKTWKKPVKPLILFLCWLTAFLCFLWRQSIFFIDVHAKWTVLGLYFLLYVRTERGFLNEDYSDSYIQTFIFFVLNLLDGNWTLDHDERFAKGFSIWDVNNDGFIDANEVHH